MDRLDRYPGVPSQSPAEAKKTSEIENEVIALFEQFRSALLRYVLSLVLPVPDAEEITQEVFVDRSFVILQLRRSRQNLCGWIFYIPHNLALEQLLRRQRDPSPDPEEQASFAQKQVQLIAFVDAECQSIFLAFLPPKTWTSGIIVNKIVSVNRSYPALRRCNRKNINSPAGGTDYERTGKLSFHPQ
jgi:hypothetical protein